MATMKDSFGRSLNSGSVKDAEDLKRQPWFAGFEDRLGDAIQQTRDLYAAA